MAKDPNYVRLREGVSVVADLDSGWSISGLAVAEFPKDDAAAAYVRTKIRAGVLEEASKAEYEEGQEVNTSGEAEASLRAKPTHQEATLRDQAATEREQRMATRSKSSKRDDDGPKQGRQGDTGGKGGA